MAEVSDLHLVSSSPTYQEEFLQYSQLVSTLQCQDNFAKICQITFGKSAVNRSWQWSCEHEYAQKMGSDRPKFLTFVLI